MNKLARYIIWISAAIIILFIAWYFSSILVYIIISAVLSMIGKPLVERFKTIRIGKFHITKSIAAGVTILILLSIFISFFLLIAPLFGKIISNFAQIDIDNITGKIAIPLSNFNRTIINIFPAIGSDFKVENLVIQEISQMINTSTIASAFSSVTSLLINTILGVLVVLFITFFFLKEENMFNSMVIALFPDKYEENIKRALESTNNLLTRYFIGISIQVFAITILNTTGLLIFAGLSFSIALIIAFLTGILNIIPYIGPRIGGTLGVIIILTTNVPEHVSIGILILTLAMVFMSTQMIDVFILQPLIFSSSVKAHPLEIFIITLVAASMGGVVGMLIAIPSYTIIRVFAREFFSHLKLVQKLTNTL